MGLPHKLLLVAALAATTPALANDTRSLHAGHLGQGVMPFDLSRILHVFSSRANGGTLDVLSRDRDAAQISMIRAHLHHEAMAFAQGDYGDPAAIHGAAMPGLAELRAGAKAMRVGFVPLPEGGRIQFTTRDRQLRDALHRWLRAQARDHGRDAAMRG